MGQVIVSGAGRGTAPSTDMPSATEMMWLYEYDGIFVVPKNGTYKIEMHGGGGGMAAQKIAGSTDVIVSTGGGSGEVHQIDLTQGASVHITIGRGGTSRFNPDSETSISGDSGESTIFGEYYEVPGGGGGNAENAGTPSGSYATKGTREIYSSDHATLAKVPGGDGNSFVTAQSYGDGGYLDRGVAYDGKPGAVIITFMGVS